MNKKLTLLLETLLRNANAPILSPFRKIQKAIKNIDFLVNRRWPIFTVFKA